MRALLSIALLSILSAPAFAVVDPVNTVPEPETLALIGVALAGLVASRLRNKK